MHFKNARNASVYAVFRAFFTQSLAKLRIISEQAAFFNINITKNMLNFPSSSHPNSAS